MGGRRLSVVDPDSIVDDWPDHIPTDARERRKAAYRKQRADEARARDYVLPGPPPAEPVEEPAPAPVPYPGYVTPEEAFPEWDWLMAPWGPPLDDPAGVAYVESQRKAREDWERDRDRRVYRSMSMWYSR